MRLSPSLATVDLWQRVAPVWQDELTHVRPTIHAIGHRLASLPAHEVVPGGAAIFRALEVSPDQVRVVIVGQDPYPDPHHACGLAFSVPPGTQPLPPSLRNIVTEVVADVGATMVASGDLQPWADQGVMLLNRSLTTEAGQRASHLGWGWQDVTNAIVQTVVRRSPLVVALLWGAHAHEMATFFPPASVLTAPHPSPLSAHRGFLGSRCFSAANRILEERHVVPVRW